MEKLTGKIPEIRFPEFKDQWEHKKLSELLSESKKTNTDLKYNKDEVLSVSGELGCVNQIEHLGRSYAGESVHNYGVVETGDIVYTKSPLKANPFGIIKLNKGKAGIVSTLYAVYKVKERNAVGEFLDCYFSLDANTNRYLRPLVKKGAKNDMKINNAYVLHDRIFIPTTTEQKRIASFFDVLNNRITQLNKKKALLEEYKKGVMQKIFSHEIRFKDAFGNDFPNWEKKKLKEVAEKIQDGTHFSPKVSEKGDYLYITSKNVKNGYIELSNAQYISESDHKNIYKRCDVKKGDILITKDGTIGQICVNEMVQEFSLLSSVAFIRASNGFSNYFIYHLLISAVGQKEIESQIAGQALKRITLTKLNNFEFQFPNLSEQIKIATLLSGIDNKISHCKNQIEQTLEYKKGLIQKMFCA